jgi:hypothetical protein
MDKYIIQNLDFYYHFDERFKTVNLCIFFNMPLNEKYIPELVIIKNLIQKTLGIGIQTDLFMLYFNIFSKEEKLLLITLSNFSLPFTPNFL